MYNQFKEWCAANGHQKIMNAFTFKEDICALYDVELDLRKNANGVPKQMFIKRGEFDPTFRPF